MLSTLLVSLALLPCAGPPARALTLDEMATRLAPYFRPPESVVGDQSKYRSPLLFDDNTPVRSAADWRKRRAEILKYWHGVMGRWPELIAKPKIEYLKAERDGNVLRQRIRLEIAPGRKTEDAYLLKPDGKGPFPAVVVVFYDAGTGIGLGKSAHRDFARQLARRGFVALSLGNPPASYYPSKDKARLQPLSYHAYVAANCYNALASLPFVDANRIGIVGHSYGGKWAMFASCLYEKFACAAWSDGGIVFDEKRSNVNYWEPWYLGHEPGGKDRKPGIPTQKNPRTGAYRKLIADKRDLHELHALMAPRPFLVSGGSEDQPERWKALNHAVAVNKLLGYTDRVAMTSRKGHSPTAESNEQMCLFLELFLKHGRAGGAGTDKHSAPAVIRIDASRSGGKVSRYLTGACIEDVNHEIYGGLYSQMLFGESFQEPSAHQPVRDFTAYGGTWAIKGEELHAGDGPGPKLVSHHAPLTRGEVGVEVFFADRAAGNAGLIVKVNKPGLGADSFSGYEVSLDPASKVLRLGRHRHNWEWIRDVACAVPVGEWIRLVARVTEDSLEITVNGKKLLTYVDRQHPLKSGGFGLRQWQRSARYRNLQVKIGEKRKPVPFQANVHPIGPVSGMWRAVKKGSAVGKCFLTTDQPFVGAQSQVVSFAKGEGEFGVENRGLNRWGLSVHDGKDYEGYVCVRADKPTELVVKLESADGEKVYARSRLRVTDKGWRRLDFTLTAKGTDPTGRFVIALDKPGEVVLGHAFLQPGPWGRFKSLPLRKDVVQGMIDMGITVLRYGGSMVNVDGYRWKKMIGPRDRRPPYKGMWYPYSTNGWGIIDFLDLCEAAGFLPIPAFHMGETPRDMADFVAYVNGPGDKGWGKKRAEAGHPAPYRLKHIELGNEERLDEKYFERFEAIAKAVWAVDPDIILVVGDFVYSQAITDPDRVKGAASGITNLSVHRKILELAKRHKREVWFDIHIGTEHPGALGELAVVPTYVKALAKLSGGAKHKVVIFELNSGNHAQRRALANAIAIGTLGSLGDRLPIVCSANGLQPDGQNDNGWDQGLLFLDPSRVWLQPPGYVTRMISRSYQTVNLSVAVEGGDKLHATAAGSADGKTLVVRVVNPAGKSVAARLDVAGFKAAKVSAVVEELAGPMDAVNTAKEPHRIRPRTREWRHGLGKGKAEYTFPPRSFTVLTLR